MEGSVFPDLDLYRKLKVSWFWSFFIQVRLDGGDANILFLEHEVNVSKWVKAQSADDDAVIHSAGY